MLPCWTLTLAPRWRPVAEWARQDHITLPCFSHGFLWFEQKPSWPLARGFKSKKIKRSSIQKMPLPHPAYWRAAPFSYNETFRLEEALCQSIWCNSSFCGVRAHYHYEIRRKMESPEMKIKLIYVENRMNLESGNSRGVWESRLLTTEVEKVTQVGAMTADKETLRSVLCHRRWWTGSQCPQIKGPAHPHRCFELRVWLDLHRYTVNERRKRWHSILHCCIATFTSLKDLNTSSSHYCINYTW